MKRPTSFDTSSGCKICSGRGVIQLPAQPRQPPTFQKCECTLVAETLSNMERAWRGLSKAGKVPSSILREKEDNDLWVTARVEDFKAHLKALASRKGPHWGFKVVSDADMMVAWLANATLKGNDILDADVAERVSLDYLTLVDLIEPPDLLIIQLGVKSARNVAMPEVLLESLAHRAHLNKPTWICDQPAYPLGIGHLAWSQGVIDFISDWEHLQIAESKKDQTQTYSDLSFAPSVGDTGIETRVAAPALSATQQSGFRTRTVELNLGGSEKPKKKKNFNRD